MRHELKTHPAPFQAVLDGDKRFEWRREDDKVFEVGDELHLREFIPEEEPDQKEKGYTGRDIITEVRWIVRHSYGMPDGYAILSIHRPPDEDNETASEIGRAAAAVIDAIGLHAMAALYPSDGYSSADFDRIVENHKLLPGEKRVEIDEAQDRKARVALALDHLRGPFNLRPDCNMIEDATRDAADEHRALKNIVERAVRASEKASSAGDAVQDMLVILEDAPERSTP